MPSSSTLYSAFGWFTTLRLSHGTGLLGYLIAATTLEHAHDLATFNVRPFRAVPGLVTIHPYTR